MTILAGLLEKYANVSSTGVACLLMATPFSVYLVKHYVKTLQYNRLQKAKVHSLTELDESLEYQKPLIVSVCGKVGSDQPLIVNPIAHLKVGSDQPLIVNPIAQLHPEICVIYEGKTEIIYEHTDKDGDQFCSLMELQSIHEQAAWYLRDDSTVKVNVEGIELATGFDLVATKREVAGPGTMVLRELALSQEVDKNMDDSAAEGIRDVNVFDTITNQMAATPLLRELAFARHLDHNEIKVIGVKHTECTLKVDSSLMIIGEAVKDPSGITIRHPYFVYEPLKSNTLRLILFARVSAWDIGSIFAFTAGFIILVDQAFQRRQRR